MNLRIVSRNIGLALIFNAFFMFLSMMVSIVYDFDSSFSPLLLSGFITAIAGIFPLIFVRKNENINIKEGFTIIILSWILSCLFGMLPYLLWGGGEFSMMNAWYESVSGYTTTGSTILRDIESLPHGLLFWRSSTHFLGGIGVVIFMLLILPSASTFRMRLSKMEISSLSQENYKFKTKQTIKVISSVYVGLTLLAFILLKIAGMGWFDAINHAFSVVATGGFSTKNLSILYYHSLPIEIIMSVFMLLASLHFGLLYNSVMTRSFKIFKSPVIKFYLVTLALFALFITLDLYFTGHTNNLFTAFRHSIFQTLSMATTSGFATADTTLWPNISILLLIYLTIQCGCSGSTTGGIKSDRVLIFLKSFKAQLKKHVHPNAVVPVRVGNHVIDKDIAVASAMYILIYVAFIFMGAMIFSLSGMDFIDSFSSSVAHMGNIGPAFGSVGVFDNYDHIPLFAKFISTIQMLLGRLEIYPLLMIFVIYKWR